MPSRVPPIARIRLARSLPRLLAWPVIVVATGSLAVATWLLGSFGTGVGGSIFAGLGVVLIAVGLLAAIVLLSVRLAVEESAIRLSWLGGERVYVLMPGPVTRVRLIGDDASRLRVRIGFLGWGLGSARLRDEEEIRVVRLARTATAILVPTDQGRLAVAPANEEELLDALSRAARARQRLEQVAEAHEPQTEADEAVTAPDAPAEETPPFLTGIERAMLEERLALERAAAAEAERAAAAEPPAPAEPPAEEAPVAAVPEPRRWWRPRRLALRRPGPSAVLLVLPLVAAGTAWGIALMQDTLPPAGSNLARLTALALVLAGPATTVGAIMARVWWPRLVGVVVAGGLASSVFIGRALIGG